MIVTKSKYLRTAMMESLFGTFLNAKFGVCLV